MTSFFLLLLLLSDGWMVCGDVFTIVLPVFFRFVLFCASFCFPFRFRSSFNWFILGTSFCFRFFTIFEWSRFSLRFELSMNGMSILSRKWNHTSFGVVFLNGISVTNQCWSAEEHQEKPLKLSCRDDIYWNNSLAFTIVTSLSSADEWPENSLRMRTESGTQRECSARATSSPMLYYNNKSTEVGANWPRFYNNSLFQQHFYRVLHSISSKHRGLTVYVMLSSLRLDIECTLRTSMLLWLSIEQTKTKPNVLAIHANRMK